MTDKESLRQQQSLNARLADRIVELEDKLMSREDASANSRQVGGDHYKSMTIQPWDFIITNDIPFMEASVIVYVTRWRRKGGVQDLKKARHFLDKLIEVAEERHAANSGTAQLPKVDRSGTEPGSGDCAAGGQ